MGNFTFHGCDVTELARAYGTPLYVVSEDEIVRRIGELRDCFDDRYPNCRTYFASKSFLSRDMLRILLREGTGLDVVSGGELYLAREMDFPPERIALHGNSKTADEIGEGLDYGVGEFVCDSIEEIVLIDEMAAAREVRPDILIRVTPGVDSHTHSYMATAGADSKFGVPLACMEEAVSLCMGLAHVDLKGFHFHVGSQIMRNESHLMAVDILLDLIKRLRDGRGFVTRVLDLGGGFGIVYTKADHPQHPREFIRPMVERVEVFCAANGLPMPALVIEPGRWIVGEAGITLYTVGSVKEIPGVRTYVGVDGGYPDNPRPELYEALYDAVPGNRYGEPATKIVTIAGKCCESGDILIRDIAMPELARGDILAVLSTGAYCHSMANNYNKMPVPALVMVKNGEPRLSIRRQTYADLFVAHI